MLSTAEGPDDSGRLTLEIFRASYPPRKIGRCVISGLDAADAQMLADFFRRYDADLLRSVGRRSFKDWISLVRVPSLGRWGSLATACEQGAELAVLAASVYLGAPHALRLTEAKDSMTRPRAWLGDEVLTSLNW